MSVWFRTLEPIAQLKTPPGSRLSVEAAKGVTRLEPGNHQFKLELFPFFDTDDQVQF